MQMHNISFVICITIIYRMHEHNNLETFSTFLIFAFSAFSSFSHFVAFFWSCFAAN